MGKFRDVTPQVHLPTMEQGVLEFWHRADVFKKTVEQTQNGPRYVFYEGPPTANGRPGIHHVLARAFKDIFPRYKTMQGYFVSRKGGWDTHGLPVELEVEKKLGFNGKKAIEDFGVAEFNRRCRQSVFDYVEEWEKLTERMGYWVDLPTAYRTLTNDYVESLWWILKQYWDRGLIYQGYKVVPYCPRCGTPLSSHELAQGYQEGTKDPSVYVKFPLKDQPGTYLLVWTTTPWTLPGNVAVAVGEDLDYVLVQHEEDRLWLAEARMAAVFEDHLDHVQVLRRVKGRELLGWHYRPLYTFLPVTEDYCYIVPGDFVSTEDGTGLVHIAPAFGADDMEVGRKFSLPTLMTVDPQGRFVDAVGPWRGIFVKEADPLIQRELTERGLMFKQGVYEHTYPFCWRCDTPLLYYARTTWYIKTTAFKDRLMANNQLINWVPEHIRDGRFGEWLENNIDWGLARERYWGTPLPFWVCDNPSCSHQECVGSVAELSQKTGRKFMNPRYLAQQLNRWPDPDQPDAEPLDLHRPAVDELTWECSECKAGTMRRVREVADAWFDSGSMPYAQWHYPFENRELFNEQYPADYICEAIDQTRGWFYTLHAVSTLLFDQPSFKNVICLGHIMAEDGSKMSKSRGNIVDPWQVFNLHGADATRWYMYTASPPGNTRRFSANLVKEVVGRFMLTLWNSYSFFVTYANLNDFDPAAAPVPLEQRSVLDRWVLARLHDLVRDVTQALETYDVTGATRPIGEFVDELSNWYVRLSRRRFWNVEADAASARLSLAAHQTLYEVLVTLAHLLAPFTPFLADEMYCNLVTGSACGGQEPSTLPGPSASKDTDSAHMGGVVPSTLPGSSASKDADSAHMGGVVPSTLPGPSASKDADSAHMRGVAPSTLPGPSASKDADSAHMGGVVHSTLPGPSASKDADSAHMRGVVHSQMHNVPPSVHLSRWPEAKAAYANPGLLADMALAQRVVGLGRAARESAGLKLRQPLAEAFVGVANRSEAEAVMRLADDVIKEELNVKALHPVTAGSDLVDVQIHALPKQLGQKHGRKFPSIRAALNTLDPLDVAAAVESGHSVMVTVDGERIEVLPDEVQVRKTPKPGLAVAQEGGYLVAVTTELTDALRWEGYAREISRNIQELRKKSGFEISDRIRTTVEGEPALTPVWQQFGAEIAADTLSVSFIAASPETDAFTTTVKLDSAEVTVGVKKV